jgi:2-polyprenyl-3-methyl-5-hydroxy-6-metoxy-1,4-benzoquinol methylase
LITAFHVIEHLSDPLGTLKSLAEKLCASGRMVIEVPNSEDALLTLYDCDAFQHFSYWSQHLFLFNAATLEILASQAGLKVKAIQHIQRYPLSNHLHWLSKGKPGGHQSWAFLDSPEMARAYANSLASLGKTDTLIAYLEPCN